MGETRLVPLSTDDPSRARFVGRSHDLAELRTASSEAAAGRGRVLLVLGDAGIGKTRLVAELTSEAEARGSRVIWGRCWEEGGAPVYWPWLQVLRGYLEEVGPEAVVNQAGVGAGRLLEFLPELRADEDDRAQVSAISVEDARFAFFDAVTRLLKQAARAAPMIIALDDLHAADIPSLLLLKFLSREIASSSLLVLGTYRDAQPGASPEAAQLIADITRAGHSLPLRGLTQEDVALLIARTGVEPSPALVVSVHAMTEGNPFFVDEMIRLLRAEGEVASARPDPSQKLPVPTAVGEILRRRVDALPPRTREYLDTAAVLGREFDLSLQTAVSGLETEDVARALEAAVSHGLIREVEGAPRHYAFVHGLIREALYSGLDPARRRGLHAAVVATLERKDDNEEHVAELAHHSLHALDLVGEERCASFLVRAGDRAMRLLAYEEAAGLYQRALNLGPSTGSTPRDRYRLLLQLAECLSRAGDISNAREACMTAVDLAREVSDAEALARAALIYGEPGLQGGVVNETLVSLLEGALRALPQTDSDLRTEALARLALELYFSDNVDRRNALSQQALDMSERVGNPRARASALRARFMASWAPDNPEERLQLAEELKELGNRSHDAALKLHAAARRITCLLELGDVTEMDAELELHRVLATEFGEPSHLWTSRSMLAMRALLEGRFQDAEKLADDAKEIGWERMQQPNAMFAHLNQILTIRIEQGRLAEQVPIIESLHSRFPRLRGWRGLLALAYLESGRGPEGRDLYRQAIASCPQWPRDSNWLHAIGWLAEVCAELGDRDGASLLYDALAPYLGRIELVCMPHPVIFWGSTSRHLGLLGTVLERYRAAEQHFEDAIAIHRRLGARGYLARTQIEWAEMLVRRDEPADRMHALRLLDDALPSAISMGLERLEARAASLRSQVHGVSNPEAPPVGAASADMADFAALLRREGDVWSLTYPGGLVHIKPMRGVDHIAYLVQRPNQDVFVLDLASPDPADGVPMSRANAAQTGLETHRTSAGELGASLDPSAKQAYKRRIDELREEITEADLWGDPERAAKAQGEIDAIAHELARAVGLGGRDRKTGSATERARVAVTKSVRSTIRKFHELDPVVGRYLDATVRTGTFCSYIPEENHSLLGRLTVQT